MTARRRTTPVQTAAAPSSPPSVGGPPPVQALQRRRRSSSLAATAETIKSLNRWDEEDRFDDVADQTVIFDGPSAFSIPTSVSSFAHRRESSTAAVSSRFFAEIFDSDADDALTETSECDQESRLYESHGGWDADEDVARQLQLQQQLQQQQGQQQQQQQQGFARNEQDLEAAVPLLDALCPARSAGGDDGDDADGVTTQKIYFEEEDLIVVITGFESIAGRMVLYYLLCCLSVGILYLVLRWLPRQKLRFLAQPAPLSRCEWMVAETQHHELSIHHVYKRPFGLPTSVLAGSHNKMDSSGEEVDDFSEIPFVRCLDYHYVRMIYHPYRGRFVSLGGWRDPNWRDLKVLCKGLESDTHSGFKKLFGDNVIDIEQKSIYSLLVDEVLHPFYVFQVASMLLWSLDKYYYYAASIFIISFISVTSTLVATRRMMQRLRMMSTYVCNVRVLRNGFWRYVSSTDLVPGDVYEVSDPDLEYFPCDGLLLSGDSIVNESMLTGESVPVSKVPATEETLRMLNLTRSKILPEVAKHYLFSGTKIVRIRRPQGEQGIDEDSAALACVVRTGFDTTKGALIRSMLFPKPNKFQLYRDSFRFIAAMAIIAIFGFILSVANFMTLGMRWSITLFRALDLITIVVPPALPATLTIGTNFALSRLMKKSIYCISPSRVNVAGKMNTICFDKTGTLTEDGLDVFGVQSVNHRAYRFRELRRTVQQIQHNPEERSVLYAMTSCHALKLVNDEIIGDPLDAKMFQFTLWTYEEAGKVWEVNEHGAYTAREGDTILDTPVVRPPGVPPPDRRNRRNQRNKDVEELGIAKVFEFAATLRRMSVIVKRLRGSKMDIYVKGAPEIMPDICRPESIPKDYAETLQYYAHRGYRVIACAHKSIAKIPWSKTQKLKREAVECDLSFMGFIIFENKLKPTSKGIILQLRNAYVRTIMCTGDNILTAISVARDCSLVWPNTRIYHPHFVEGDSTTAKARLRWTNIDNEGEMLNSDTLLPNQDLGLPGEFRMNYALAIPGDVFRWIIDFAPEHILERMLVLGQVFARMSPDEKHELVDKLQDIDYCVGFCGDGANDCGALKAADVGISLSEAEASVAAPFTSRNFDICCVLDVMKEGRAALVTSFICFKYMALYSSIQFVTVTILYKFGSNLSDFEFLFIDLFLIMPIAVFMSWNGPFDTLYYKRPTAKLVSEKVMTSLIIQIFILGMFQYFIHNRVSYQSWYQPPSQVEKDFSSPDNTALFLLSCYQYIIIALILSVGPPYRTSMLTNYPFIIMIGLSLSFVTLLTFLPPIWTINLFHLYPIPWKFGLLIVSTAFANYAISAFAEYYFSPTIAMIIKKLRDLKRRKKYKRIRSSFI